MVDALRPNTYEEADIEGWEADPLAACERIFPGSSALVKKYGLDIGRRPGVTRAFGGWEEIGYAPSRHFGTFLEELRRLDAEGGEAMVRTVSCPY